MIGLDGRGPERAKSALGRRLVRAQAQDQPDGTGRPAARGPHEADDGRRGTGDIFGAFRPATGDVFTQPYERRTTANGSDCLAHVEAWLPTDGHPVQAIVDNLSAHRATEVLLFSWTHPRWEFVFQPKYAAYLNLIEPWWQVRRSLALQGRRCESWAEVCQAVEAATAYWHQHRHPCVWDRRRRHQPRRKPGRRRSHGILISVLHILKKRHMDVGAQQQQVLAQLACSLHQDPFPLFLPTSPP